MGRGDLRRRGSSGPIRCLADRVRRHSYTVLASGRFDPVNYGLFFKDDQYSTS